MLKQGSNNRVANILSRKEGEKGVKIINFVGDTSGGTNSPVV